MNRKIVLVLLILVSICAISHVSAAEDSDLFSADDSDIQAVDESSINLEESQEDSQISSASHQIDSNNGTVDKIQETINSAGEGDTIYLNGTFTFNKTVNINKKVNIIGVGDGANIKLDILLKRAFNIESSASGVVLANLTFRNGNINSTVLWQGDGGVIENCKFYDNVPSGKKGGAIYLTGNNCNVTNCVFNQNVAKNGGALYVEGNNNLIYSCEFIDNKAGDSNSSGGAIYSNGDDLKINYCKFTNNQAATCAGAILVNGKSNAISFCIFNGNFIESNATGGGAIYCNGDNFVIDYCNFTNNRAPESNGGAIVLMGNLAQVKNSYFMDNSASNGKDIYSNPSSIVMKNNFFLRISENITDSVYGIPVADLEYPYNNFTVIKEDSTIAFVSTGIVFEYASVSDPIRLTVKGGKVDKANITVLNKDKTGRVNANIDFNPSTYILRISNLDIGEYVLRVTTTPEDDYYSTSNDLTITVKKATAVIRASSITVAMNKGSQWTIKLVNSKSGKPISNMALTLKVFTGKKVQTLSVKTNSKGEASYQTKKLSKGTHTVIVSGKDSRYNFNTLKSSIKVVKQKAIKFKVQRTTAKDGAQLMIQVLNKKTKKPINGVQIKLLIKDGKTYKTVTLKTKKLGKTKGICGYSTNKLSVGKHKVKIMPNTIVYSGSASSSMKITKKAKSHPPWETKISA